MKRLITVLVTSICVIVGSTSLFLPAASASTEIQVDDVRRAIEAKEVEVFAGIGSLEFGAARIMNGDDGTTIVATPIAGFDPGSNFTVAFDSATGEIQQTAEAHLTATSDTSGMVRIWQDGEATVDQEFTDRDVMNPGPTADGFVERLNRCLSNAGIPAWIIAGLAVGCGAGPPAARVACIVAAGIGLGTANFCVRYALDDRR